MIFVVRHFSKRLTLICSRFRGKIPGMTFIKTIQRLFTKIVRCTLMYDGLFSHFFNRNSSPFLAMGIYDASHSISNSFCMCLHCTFQKKMQNIFMAFVHLLQIRKLHADGLPWKFKFSLYQ